MIATLDTIRLDLDRYSESRRVRGHIYRMRRRLKGRLAKIDALEKSLGIWDRHFDAVTAERELYELAKRLFDQPAPTMAAVVVQAKALSAFAAIEGGGYVQHESGRFGLILADGLQQIARAT